MEGEYRWQRLTTWFLWKEGVKPSDIHRRLSTICGKKAPAGSTVCNRARSFNSDKETIQAAVQRR
jgi:hypothetical protein